MRPTAINQLVLHRLFIKRVANTWREIFGSSTEAKHGGHGGFGYISLSPPICGLSSLRISKMSRISPRKGTYTDATQSPMRYIWSSLVGTITDIVR